MAVLDSSFLIDLAKGVPGATERLTELEDGAEPLRVPAAVWVEYLHTFPPATRREERQLLEAYVLFEPFSRSIADEAARLQHELQKDGARLGWHDLQVATTALHHDEPVVSRDEAFGRVPGITVLSW